MKRDEGFRVKRKGGKVGRKALQRMELGRDVRLAARELIKRGVASRSHCQAHPSSGKRSR